MLPSGQALDVQDVLSRFTMDSATEFLFGNCVNSLDEGLPFPRDVKLERGTRKPTTFAQAFVDAQFAASRRLFLGPVWPLFEILHDKTKEPMEVVKAYLNPILTAAVRKKRESGEALAAPDAVQESEEEMTLLDHLVKFTDGEINCDVSSSIGL